MPRLGWYVDGLPDEVTPPSAVMLQDDGARITLTVTWRSDLTQTALQRIFRGENVLYEDDPERTRHVYTLPSEMVFFDADGMVALVGCQVAESRESATLAGDGVVTVRAAVLGGRTLDYGDINGMRTFIPELGRWAQLTSVTERRETDEDGRLRKYEIALEAPESIPLDDYMELKVKPTWRWRRGEDHARQIHDDVCVESMTDDPRPWTEHLSAHRLVRELLDVAAWEPFGYSRVLVNRTDDPVRLLSGEAVSQRWAEARTYAVRPSRPLARRPSYLFSLREVGKEGFGRWRDLRSKFERGLNPIMSLLDMADAHVETRLVQSAIGLEAIGYQVALDAGVSPKTAGRESMATRLQRLEADLPVVVVRAGWHQRCADLYNGVKHADRDLPDVQSMLNVYKENTLVCRAWVAAEVGISAHLIAERLELHTDAQYLAQQDLAARMQARSSTP